MSRKKLDPEIWALQQRVTDALKRYRHADMEDQRHMREAQKIVVEIRERSGITGS